MEVESPKTADKKGELPNRRRSDHRLEWDTRGKVTDKVSLLVARHPLFTDPYSYINLDTSHAN